VMSPSGESCVGGIIGGHGSSTCSVASSFNNADGCKRDADRGKLVSETRCQKDLPEVIVHMCSGELSKRML